MVKMSMVYEGDLRCRLTHGPSGDEILTDAPVDNHGKGEAFSPTDLMAAALGSCMLTVMGIAARKNNVSMDGTTADVEKEMVTAPVRRVGKITVMIRMAAGIDPVKRSILENAAHTCPVHKSMHPGVQIAVNFIYQ